MNAHSHGLNNHTHSFSWSGTTSDMSKNSTGAFGLNSDINYGRVPVANFAIGCFSLANYQENWVSSDDYIGKGWAKSVKIDVSHTHTYSGSGTTGGNSGNTTNTTSTGSFTGSAGTTSYAGNGTSFSIMPPYITKYCWERTA